MKIARLPAKEWNVATMDAEDSVVNVLLEPSAPLMAYA